jgi:hypothetical protein
MPNLRRKDAVPGMSAIVEGCKVVFEATELMLDPKVFPMVK